ncbi:MAG: outer membrane lipoprotein-sorting protein [Candidatus Korobacteraceae bacterium]
MRATRILAALALLALLAGGTGCLFRTRTAEIRTSTAKLETATRQELIDRLNTEAAKIKTLNLTVDIATSVGGEKKGKVTDYEEIRGYILVRKPDMLRMIGLFPIVRNKAFDMVSQGDEFKLSIPAKNKFYVGHGSVAHLSSNSLENMRPQVIYNALLMPAIDLQNDIAVLEDSTQIIYDPKNKKTLEQPDYVIDILERKGDQWYLSRKIIFDRTTLVPHQQLIYDENGAVATEATYQVYQDYNGVRFPSVIQINRPQEEYSIRLTVVKLVINDPLRDDQFALQQPAGSLLVDLDQPQPTAANNTASPSSSSNPAKP